MWPAIGPTRSRQAQRHTPSSNPAAPTATRKAGGWLSAWAATKASVLPATAAGGPAARLAEWMTDRGIAMEQLLDAAALDRKVLNAIIHGRYTPSPQQRQRVAAALGIRPEQVSWGHTAPVEVGV